MFYLSNLDEKIIRTTVSGQVDNFTVVYLTLPAAEMQEYRKTVVVKNSPKVYSNLFKALSHYRFGGLNEKKTILYHFPIQI